MEFHPGVHLLTFKSSSPGTTFLLTKTRNISPWPQKIEGRSQRIGMAHAFDNGISSSSIRKLLHPLNQSYTPSEYN